MRTCPQCGREYQEDLNFCLVDGATLISETAPTVANIEVPTVIRSAPTTIPIPISTQPSVQANFQPAFAAPEPERSRPVFLYFVIGLLFLAVLGIGGGFAAYVLWPADGNGNGNGRGMTNSTPASGNKSDSQEDKDKLKAEQDKLEEDRRKLEEEKKKLEEKKKQTPTPLPTPPPDTGRTGYIIDPPSNVRATPNGRIICVIRGAGTAVRILGSTGVTDSNGTWYYTDACGQRGVIHSSQFRY